MRPVQAVRRLPLRVRLVAAFAAVMLALLAAAGAFVYWRVQVALDHTLDGELDAQAGALQRAARDHPGKPAAVVAAVPVDSYAQVLDASGRVLAATPSATSLVLLARRDLRSASSGRVDLDPGNVLTGGKRRLRGAAFPLPSGGGQPLVAVAAVRLGQRDEALRELLAQLAVANLVALAVASAVGYRLARSALLPVERYRVRAEQIAGGASGVRLDVPAGTDDEVSRLGHTLNRMLAAQEHAAEQQRQFLADASHELRSPLTVLTSEVELALRRPRTAAEYEQALQQVAQDTARLVTLADQLLDLEQASAALGPDVADVPAALQRAAERGRARLREAEREVHVVAGGPSRAALPDVALDQLLGNLVDNAVVHGAGTITLAAAASGDVVVLTVTDEGSGPPEELVPHLVERFRRADPARSTPGSGLGLAVVHALVVAHGGELRLCSGGRHHRFPPHLHPAVACAHADAGTCSSVVLGARP